MTTLLVASGGGHLKQLHKLAPRLGVESDRAWITFDTALSRSLLETEDVSYAPYANPHDIKGTFRDAMFGMGLLRRRHFDRVISTGANLAVALLPQARVRGALAQYIESATRSQGPSASGRILQMTPGIDLYTQHRAWAKGRWKYGGSVFENFQATHAEGQLPRSDGKRIVITLGSNDSYPFRALVDRVQSILPAGVEVLWQLGSTPAQIPGTRADVPFDELFSAMERADAVIAHAGTGSALTALEAGKLPILVTRRSSRGEHIDDHQELTAEYLSSLGLALAVEADALSWNDVEVAAQWKVTERPDPPPFVF